MTYEGLLAFAVTCLVIELTPGPNMGYLAVLSAREGRRAGFSATLGIALGLIIVGLAAALGLSTLIERSRWLYEVWRWCGVLYLLWLAYEGWRGEEETSPGNARVAASDATYFRRGLVTNLLNPKAGVFYVAILPTFFEEGSPVLPQAMILSLVYVGVATTVHSAIVLLADAAEPWLNDPQRSRLIRRILSVALIGIAFWLLYSTRLPSSA